MMIAAYAATGLLMAGIHAVLMLRDRSNLFHRRALAIGLAVGGAASAIQPMSGHIAAQAVARTQPVKLAAMEGQFRTESSALSQLRIRVGHSSRIAVDAGNKEVPHAQEVYRTADGSGT